MQSDLQLAAPRLLFSKFTPLRAGLPSWHASPGLPPNIFPFSMRKIQVALVGLLGLILGLGAFLSLKREALLQTQLANAQQKTPGLNQAIAEAEERGRRQEKEERERQARVAAQVNPVLKERYELDMIIRKGQLDTEYVFLFRKLKLPHDKADKLKELIVDRKQAIYDANKIASLSGLLIPPSEKEGFEKIAAAQIDSRIRNELGNEVCDYLQFYDTTRNWRFMPLQSSIESPYEGLRFSEEIDDASMQKIDDMAAKLRDLAKTELQDLYDRQFYANDIPSYPETFLEKASSFLPAKLIGQLRASNEFSAIHNRLHDIERAAAYAGKLHLTRGSAKEYGVGQTPNTKPATVQQ
jgi:hypothetical protein